MYYTHIVSLTLLLLSYTHICIHMSYTHTLLLYPHWIIITIYPMVCFHSQPGPWAGYSRSAETLPRKRIHFHEWMIDVHSRLHQRQKGALTNGNSLDEWQPCTYLLMIHNMYVCIYIYTHTMYIYIYYIYLYIYTYYVHIC